MEGVIVFEEFNT